jgi:hypothetical protein
VSTFHEPLGSALSGLLELSDGQQRQKQTVPWFMRSLFALGLRLDASWG